LPAANARLIHPAVPIKRAQQAATVEMSEKEGKSMKSLEEAGRLIATTQPVTSAIRDDMKRSPSCPFFVRRTEPGVHQASHNFLLRMPLV
jgi:hypothetical protein